MSLPFKASVTRGQGADAREAARDAGARARAANPNARLALVFASFALDQAQVVAGAREGLGDIPFVGGSSFAEISTTGFHNQSVVVMTLTGEFSFGTAAAPLGADPAAAAAQIAREARERLGRPAAVALLFASTETGAGVPIVQAIDRELGPGSALIYGAGCGCLNEGPGRMGPSHAYRDGELSTVGVSLALLAFDGPTVRLATSSGHGLQPISVPLIATKADPQWVYEVDGQPILDFYEKYLARRVEDLGAYIFTYPFLQQIEEGTTAAQVPLMLDREAGRIAFFPRSPLQGESVSLAHASREQLLRACREAAFRAKVALGGARPALVFVVSCVARQMILGTRTAEEVQIVNEVFGRDVPVIGLYSAMEIAPMSLRTLSGGSQWGSHAVAETFCLLVLGDASEIGLPSRPPGIDLDANDQLSPERAYQAARAEIDQLRRQIQESDALLDFREQVLMKTIQDNVEMTRELKSANLELSELNRKNQAILKMIRQYTPHTTWTKAGKHVDEGRLEIPDEVTELTYLFLDVSGFTRYSETHAAEEVIDALNGVLKPACEAILDHGGDVNKFIGDALFATFESPIAAVQAGLAICRRDEGASPFKVRIGIHCGRAILGNVGSDQRKDNTLIGDAVNLSQRLEAACTPGRVLISQAVRDRVIDYLPILGDARQIQVKGKSEIIDVFEFDPEV